ncbi:MAG: hypothetical protein II336_13555 [Loktanella sp.]|nr:hypothetical protein [Loktanella sp.]
MNVTFTKESTWPEIMGPIRAAKTDDELKDCIWEIGREGKRVFGNGFTIRVDETSMSKRMNRVFVYVPDWDIEVRS